MNPLRLTGGPVNLIEAAAGEGGKVPRFEMDLYHGGAITVAGYGRIVLDLAGLAIPSRAIPVHRDHDPGQVVGHGKARIEAGVVKVAGLVSGAGPAAAEVVAAGKNGFPWQASIEAEPIRAEELRTGATAKVNGRSVSGPLSIIRKAQLKGASFVSLGADSSTSAKVAAKRKDAGMEPETTITEKTAEELGTEKERQRVAGIEAACKGDWSDEDKSKVEDIKAAAIASGTAVAQVNGELLKILRASRPEGSAPAFVRGQAHEPLKMAQAGLLLVNGREDLAVKVLGEDVTTAARKQGHLNALDLLETCLTLEGIEPARFRGHREKMIAAAFSSAVLDSLISNTTDLLLLPTPNDALPTWESFARKVDLKSFRAHTGVKVKGRFELDELPNTGEVHHADLTDDGTSIQLATHAKMLRLSRQDMIDDRLGALSDFTGAFRKAAWAKRSKILYTALLANAGSHYSSDNGNYQSGAETALSATSLAAAIVLLRAQANRDGEPLDILPVVLLVPPTLEHTAKELLHAEVVLDPSGTAGISNVQKGSLKLEVEARLEAAAYTGYSSTGWYLLGGPADAPVLMGYLNGARQPVVESFGLTSEAGTLGVTWRVYDDMGAALGDTQASVFSKGAE